MHVHITGAGVVGLSIANELLRRDISVSIHDINPVPGPNACAWWAGGMLAPYCERESAEEDVFRLGLEAAGWWQDMGATIHYNGSLVVALERDRNELRRFDRRAPGGTQLDPSNLATLEPDLGDRFQTALHFPDEAHLVPRQALQQLVDNLAAGDVYIGKEERPADLHIDCRGYAARDVLTDLRGVKGEMLILHCPDIALSRPVRLLHPRHPLYIVPRGDGVFMLGATMIESGERNRVTARSMMELLNAAYALHPAFGEAEILETGVDARPAFADNMPRIRRIDGRIHVNGMFRHGYLLSPALARMTADLIQYGDDAKEVRNETVCEW